MPKQVGLAQLFNCVGGLAAAAVQAHHAWLFYPGDAGPWSEAARQRGLRPSREFAQLGSGSYHWRGATWKKSGGVPANLLGGGAEAARWKRIGFDLYMEMLQEILRRNPGPGHPAWKHPESDLTDHRLAIRPELDHRSPTRRCGPYRAAGRRLRRQGRTAWSFGRRLDRPGYGACRAPVEQACWQADWSLKLSPSAAAFRASNPKTQSGARNRWKNPPSACCAGFASTTCMAGWCTQGGARQQQGQSAGPRLSVLPAASSSKP